MLPEIGASELLVIAVVALIVVGPKDLPMLLRKLGQFMAKLRGMAADFRASFDEMARQSELDELRQQVDALRRGQLDEIAALKADEAEVAQVFDEIGQELHASTIPGPTLSHDYAAIESLPPVEPAPAKPPRQRRKPAVEGVDPPKPARSRAKRARTVS